MYEELRNKKVKMIVGTNSGVSTGALRSVCTGALTIEGLFSEYDNDLVKIKSAKISGADTGSTSLSFTKGVIYNSSEENYDVLYVNKSGIITIAVLS